VTEVLADLSTFVTVRQQPRGPVETFSMERSTDTVERAMTTEDAALILLRFDGGARGSVSISQVSAGRKNSIQWEIGGSAAAAAWDGETPDHLWIGHRERPNELLLRNPALMNEAGVAAASLPGGHVEGFGDTFHALFREIYRAILAGRPPADPAYATFLDGHVEMLIGDAIGRSAQEGRWVEVAAA
jgi:predicted dehydrogenase